MAGQPCRHGLLISPESGFVEVIFVSELLQGLNVCGVVFVKYCVGIEVVNVWLFDVDNFADLVARPNEVETVQKVCATTIWKDEIAARIEQIIVRLRVCQPTCFRLVSRNDLVLQFFEKTGAFHNFDSSRSYSYSVSVCPRHL